MKTFELLKWTMVCALGVFTLASCDDDDDDDRTPVPAEVQSAFSRLNTCKGFLWVTLIILAGQILIVSVGGSLFSVTPLQLMDWIYIFAATSIVLWIGEIYRLIRRIVA